MKNSRNIIIGTVLFVIIIMAVGYSAFATQSIINGTAEIIGKWDVKIKSVDINYVSEGCDAGVPEFTDTSVKFSTKLVKPGDYVTYAITIENAGTIDAKLNTNSFTEEENGSEAIVYKVSDPIDVLEAGKIVVVLVHVGYDENAVEVPEKTTKSITGIIEYVQK